MSNSEKELRIVFKLPQTLAIYNLAILPLMKKNGLKEKALEIYEKLRQDNKVTCVFDDSGSIGKRYRKQDENGTLICVCVDYQTFEDNTITIRNRDEMKQKRIPIKDLFSLNFDYFF
jgi:glycyl-tRNA synthetase